MASSWCREPRRLATVLLAAFVIVLVVPLGALPVAAQDAPAEAAAEGPLWSLEDPRGDPSPFGLYGPWGETTPVGEAYGHIDLVALQVLSESWDEYQVGFKVAGRDTLTPVLEAGAVVDVRCTLQWMFNDRDEAYYSLWVNEQLDAAPGEEPMDSHLYTYLQKRSERAGDVDYTSAGDRVSAHYDRDLPGLVVTIPKDFTTVPPSDSLPVKGDRMTGLRGSCSTDIAGYGSMWDGISAEEGHHFVTVGPGETVSVRFHDRLGEVDSAVPWTASGLSRTVTGLGPGTTTLVPLMLENQVDSKRIVSLRAEARDPSGAVLPWNITIAPNVELAAGAMRTVNLIVTPPSDAAPGQEAELMVELRPLGVDDAGRAYRDARVMPALTPEANVLRFHARPDSEPLPQASGTPASDFFRGWDFSLSQLAEEPGWSDAPASIGSTRCTGSDFALPALTQGFRLDPEGTFDLKLDFTSETTGAPTVFFAFGSDRHEEMVAYSGQVSLEGDGVVNLPVPEDVDVQVPAGTVLYGYLTLCNPPFNSERSIDYTFHAKTSSFTLPIAAAATEETTITDGTYLPTLSLARGEDAQAYVNPGKTWTFGLVLANEGVETDDLRVSPAFDTARAKGWTVEIVPGTLFRVPAGESTPFGVAVTPPADAAEGAVLDVNVTAVSKHDKEARSTFRLGVIVTGGVQIEEKTYAETAEQIAPLTEAEESPGSTVVPILALLLGSLAVVRRRRA